MSEKGAQSKICRAVEPSEAAVWPGPSPRLLAALMEAHSASGAVHWSLVSACLEIDGIPQAAAWDGLRCSDGG